MNIYDHTWDARPNMNISLADIDTARVMWALRETVEHHRLNRDALSITDPMDVLLGYHLLYDDKKIWSMLQMFCLAKILASCMFNVN